MPLVTKDKIEKLLAKNLTGFEAAKLVIADSVEVDHGRDGFLSEKDIRQIKAGLLGQEAQVYNNWIEAYRAVSFTNKEAKIMAYEIIVGLLEFIPLIQKYYLNEAIRLARWHTPALVTQKQYEDIAARQREAKLKEVWDLADVVNHRAQDLAPQYGLEEDALEAYEFLDSEGVAGLAKDYPELYKAVAVEVEELIHSGRLSLQEEGQPDFERPETLSSFHCTVETLYELGLIRWLQRYVDETDSNSDWQRETGDPRSMRGYAIVQDPSEYALDERGHWKQDPFGIIEAWVGLKWREEDAIEATGMTLRELLESHNKVARTELSIFLGLQAVLETLSEVLGVKLTEDVEEWYGRIESEVKTYNRLLTETSRPETVAVGGSSIPEELRAAKLPRLSMAKLKPKASSIKYFRERMAMSLGTKWWDLAQELEFEDVEPDFRIWEEEEANA